MSNPKFDVIVIGAGPAGLLAAGKAASEGAKVLLLEKMEKPARKLRITGKGRCNITNVKPLDEFLDELYPEPQFLRDAFREFFSDDIIELLNNHGVETVIERGQRVFPASGKAWDVAEALVKWARSNGAEIITHAKVDKINLNAAVIDSLTYTSTNTNVSQTISCKTVIIATGGLSYPATGSTGDGYTIAEECGHKVTPLRPALVGFETSPVFTRSAGITLKNVNLTVNIDGKKVNEEFGDLEITPYGLSGPIVLKVSRRLVEALAQGKKPEVLIDFKPALSHQKLDARLLREIQESPRIAVIDLLRKLVPKEIAIQMIDDLELAAQKTLARISAEERKEIRIWLKELKFEVIANRSWSEAIITAGGISLKEVNPRTMESKLIKGLYFAGELLDLDGSTGGYNLQIAFSTGWLAGKEAAHWALSNEEVEH